MCIIMSFVEEAERLVVVFEWCGGFVCSRFDTMAQALLSKLASAAEFVAVPGAILVAYFTTSRSTEPKRGRK